MAKNKPIITHVEILCLAIHSIENEIKKTEYYGDIPEFMTYREKIVSELEPKLEALKEMYRIETGTTYV